MTTGEKSCVAGAAVLAFTMCPLITIGVGVLALIACCNSKPAVEKVVIYRRRR